jgi:hypothetical protein
MNGWVEGPADDTLGLPIGAGSAGWASADGHVVVSELAG